MGEFSGMLLVTLGTSLLGNMLKEKRSYELIKKQLEKDKNFNTVSSIEGF